MANVVCTEAADYRTRWRYTVVVTDGHTLFTSASIHNAQTSDEVEKLAVSLAIANAEAETVITDSQSAYRSFLVGRLTTASLRSLT